MARTIRRLRGWQQVPSYTVDHGKVPAWEEGDDFASLFFRIGTYEKAYATNDPEYARAWWRIHADTDAGRKRFPSGFFRTLNKRVSRQEEQSLRRACREDKLAELTFNARKRCGWTQY